MSNRTKLRLPRLLESEPEPDEASDLLASALREAREDKPDDAHVNALSEKVAQAVATDVPPKMRKSQ